MAVIGLTGSPSLATLRPVWMAARGVRGWRALVACAVGVLAACSAGGGGGDGGTVGVSPPPTVIIVAPTTTVYKGQSAQFSATVVDAGPGVVWSVEGGATYGTITAEGLYSAPSTVPDGPAIVRATSTDDPRGTSTASIQVIVGTDSLAVSANRALSPVNAIANTFSGGQRSVAISGSTIFMVWNDDHAGDQDVYLSVSQDRGVTLGAPIRVNDDGTTAAQLAPSVAVDASGRAVIAWIDARWYLDPTYDVYVATASIDATGAVTMGPNQRVTTVGTHESRDPSVALAFDGLGNAYLAWGDGTNGDTDVFVTKGTRLPSGLFNLTPAVRVHEQYVSDQSRPSVAADASGNVVVAWNDRQSGIDRDVYWRRGRFTVAGVMEWTTPAEIRVNLQTEGDQVSPSVAMDSDGVAYVAWGQQVGLERRKLYVAKSSGSDMTVTANTDVFSTVDADQNFPSLAVSGSALSGVEVTIGFADNRECPQCAVDPLNPNGTGPTDVYVVRSADGGATFGSSLRVNDDPTGTALHGRASVAVDDVGRAYLVWTDGRNATSPQARAFMARVE